MSSRPASAAEADDNAAGLLAVYDSALPHVYGYLLTRCGRRALAEELTAETFLAAVDAVQRGQAPPPSTPWLIGIARHKLVDHWRREARQERYLQALAADEADPRDPWDVELDALTARAVLQQLAHNTVSCSRCAILTTCPLQTWPTSSIGRCTPRRRCSCGPEPRSGVPIKQGRGSRPVPDPFEALRTPVSPIQPDASFSVRLRERLARALKFPTESVMPTQTVPVDPTPSPAEPTQSSAEPTQSPVEPTHSSLDPTHRPAEPTHSAAEPTHRAAGAPTLTPYLAVADARRALAWYADIFGARPRGEPIVMPNGRIGHAELELSGALLFLADEAPDIRFRAPEPGGDVSVTLQLNVPDVDRLIERAVRAGAVVERPPADQPYGRTAAMRDPFGHRWLLTVVPSASISTDLPQPGVPSASISADLLQPGDIGYVSLWVPEADRAAEFFGDVLGWHYAPAPDNATRQVTTTRLSHGIASLASVPSDVWGPQTHSTLLLCFFVEDVDQAVDRVRAAGGRAEQPVDQPYGRTASCTDDQGLPFALYTPPPGQRPNRPSLSRAGAGDLAYVAIGTRDADRARAFFEAVLGWHFRPGQTPGGWEVTDVAPMTGLMGGHTRPAVVPMYRVDNIEAAVARVRAAGGHATDPVHTPYGLTSTCTDNQGTSFYLGQL